MPSGKSASRISEASPTARSDRRQPQEVIVANRKKSGSGFLKPGLEPVEQIADLRLLDR